MSGDEVVSPRAPRGFPRAARLVDIAEAAGVSIKTVSRVLNGEPYVTDAMRERVLGAVDDLGYTTDNRARLLRTSKSGYLGLIVPDIRNGFFAGLTHNIEKRLSSSGQTILLGISDESPEKEERYLRLFRQQRVDGLIVLPAGAPSLADVSRRLPIVVLDRTVESIRSRADHVLVNNREAARVLTRHLVEHHRLRQVAMVTGEAAISSVHERQLGYADVLAEAGLQPFESSGHTSQGEAAAGALQLFRTMEPPFGVLATGNRMFSAAMTAITRLGLRVPRDVAIVTFDGVGDPDLTGMTPTRATLPVPTMAARALQLLTERSNDPARPFREILLDCDIEYGVTCGCVEADQTPPLKVARRTADR
ncbi:LacI family DNA-binding transcriptional regulator [Cellulomonas sp. KRMCY2]|uniref:LacI family DNA-binding transcriptional regulator n=1 Tax=Cellulomonas sp. KRMCY2 TaxID=1304865 RepID=UPI0009DF7FA3|nr:LacI family DNA-binding transcriptional regulator [Cellulomonas sp. KRMCY2]